MTEKEAKKIKIGDRVEYRFVDIPHEDNGSLGTVIDRDYARFKVKWDDDVECSYLYILAMSIHRAT